MEKWEKKINLSQKGSTVLAEYARMKTFHIEFGSSDEARIFIQEFEAAQSQLEKNGKLTSRVSVIGDPRSFTIDFKFGDNRSSIKLKAQLDSIQEMYQFYGYLREEITKYST